MVVRLKRRGSPGAVREYLQILEQQALPEILARLDVSWPDLRRDLTEVRAVDLTLHGQRSPQTKLSKMSLS